MKGDSGDRRSVSLMLICILRWKTPACVQRLQEQGLQALVWIRWRQKVRELFLEEAGGRLGPPNLLDLCSLEPAGRSWRVVGRRCTRRALLAGMFSTKRQAGDPWEERGRGGGLWSVVGLV